MPLVGQGGWSCPLWHVVFAAVDVDPDDMVLDFDPTFRGLTTIEAGLPDIDRLLDQVI